jgi:hypothetical protein
MLEGQATQGTALGNPLSFHIRHLLEKGKEQADKGDQQYENVEQESRSTSEHITALRGKGEEAKYE